MITASATTALIERTVAAIRHAFGEGSTLLPEGSVDPWAVSRRSREDVRVLLDRCLRAGVTVRLLALKSGVAGHLLVPLIDHPQQRADAYAAEIHNLERALETVRSQRMQAAVAEVREGEELSRLERNAAGLEKQQVAKRWGVSRPTLDAWIAAVSKWVAPQAQPD